MDSGATYLHGTSPAEQGRLSLLHRLMNEAALDELSLRGGEKVVDFGSGLGQLSRGIARAAGRQVVAIERSAEQIAEAARQAAQAGEPARLDLRRGDVLDPPPRADERGSFDAAHARFILQRVPDPGAVARQMGRAGRPGAPTG